LANAILVVLVLARVAGVVFAATTNIRGDYYASLPGAYVRDVNPVLWDSPDLQGTWGYHRDTYYHGPVQYLTLYPVAYFDSYAQIAQVLLLVYGVVLAAAFVCLRGAAARLAPATPLTVPMLVATFLFFPLLQAWLQREFEVVILLGLSAALWLLVRDRREASAAVLAYVAWFKYIPLLFAGYLAWRGWTRAAVVFVIASMSILGVTALVFGLTGFINNNVPTHAAQVFAVWSYGFRSEVAGHVEGTGFCQGWFTIETTLANLRHGFCGVSARHPWFPANVAYLLVSVVTAGVYLTTHRRLERQPAAADVERWRRAIEFSIVTTVCATFFFAHYYYLILLAVPFNVLLVRYLSDGRAGALVAWFVSYALVSAFVVPTSMLTRVLGANAWELYISSGAFLYGELLLLGLLLWEYRRLGATPWRRG
jgi:hypothetical protein